MIQRIQTTLFNSIVITILGAGCTVFYEFYVRLMLLEKKYSLEKRGFFRFHCFFIIVAVLGGL